MERRDEQKAKKEDAQWINACHTGPLPAFVEDVDDEDNKLQPDLESTPEEQLEEGDQIWATGLLPEPEHIQASSTISQWLAKAFKWNSQLMDYEKHIPPTSVISSRSSPKSPSMICLNPNHGIMLSSS
jgi:hypothetical protein